MRVIKNINNNVSLCLDSDGNELIAFGKGIGFSSPPYDIKDLCAIKRTFYDIDPRYYSMLSQIDELAFEVSIQIVDYARSVLDTQLNANIVFTLSDHIDFVIKRYREEMDMRFSQFHDLKHLYPDEILVGKYALSLINKAFDIELSKDEINSIALHFINAASITKGASKQGTYESIIKEVVRIIETFFDLAIDKEGFNYSRFASHIEYLLKRSVEGYEVSSTNLAMFQGIIQEFPETHKCAVPVREYIDAQYGSKLNKEEELYLILHINRLCARADCYR